MVWWYPVECFQLQAEQKGREATRGAMPSEMGSRDRGEGRGMQCVVLKDANRPEDEGYRVGYRVLEATRTGILEMNL